jgi:hypothetical protein
VLRLDSLVLLNDQQGHQTVRGQKDNDEQGKEGHLSLWSRNRDPIIVAE